MIQTALMAGGIFIQPGVCATILDVNPPKLNRKRPLAKDGAPGFDRPKYGVQNVMNDPRGVVKCKQ